MSFPDLPLVIAGCALAAAIIAAEHGFAALFHWGVGPVGIIARYVAGCLAILAGLAIILPPWLIALVFAVMASAGASTILMYVLTHKHRKTPEIDHWRIRAEEAERYIDSLGGEDGIS